VVLSYATPTTPKPVRRINLLRYPTADAAARYTERRVDAPNPPLCLHGCGAPRDLRVRHQPASVSNHNRLLTPETLETVTEATERAALVAYCAQMRETAERAGSSRGSGGAT